MPPPNVDVVPVGKFAEPPKAPKSQEMTAWQAESRDLIPEDKFVEMWDAAKAGQAPFPRYDGFPGLANGKAPLCCAICKSCRCCTCCGASVSGMDWSFDGCVFDSIQRTVEAYVGNSSAEGKGSGVGIGGAVFIAQGEDARTILKYNFGKVDHTGGGAEAFCPKNIQYADPEKPIYNLISADGEDWWTQRKFFESINMDKIFRANFDAIVANVDRVVMRWLHAPGAVDLQLELQDLHYENIMHIFCGRPRAELSLPTMEDTFVVTKWVDRKMRRLRPPPLKWFPMFPDPGDEGAAPFVEKCWAVSRAVVERAFKNPAEFPNSLLGTWASEQQMPDQQYQLSQEQITDNFLAWPHGGMYSGVTHIINTLLGLYYQDPDGKHIRMKIRQKELTFDSLNDLNEVYCALAEGARFLSPVPLMPRILDYESTAVTKGALPPLSKVMCVNRNNHYDTAYWGEDAASFNIARWTSKRLQENPMHGESIHFWPWAQGRRRCMGQEIQLFLAKIVVSRIVQQCDLQFSGSTKQGFFFGSNTLYFLKARAMKIDPTQNRDLRHFGGCAIQ